MRSILVICILATACPEATAQPTSTAPLSEQVAQGLSLGGTLVSWGLVVGAFKADADSAVGLLVLGGVGVVVAPSFGPWYARAAFTRGLGLRLLGGPMAVAGLIMQLDCYPDECRESGGEPRERRRMLFVGGAMFIGGTLDDILGAPRRARAHNDRHRVALVPLAGRAASGARTRHARAQCVRVRGVCVSP